jgi:phosphohistidine phosphatase
MKTLTLLRHAKSAWDDPVARDFDRPLNGKGRRAAARMGDFMRESGMVFDQVFASPAVRVRQTIGGVEDGYGQTLHPIFDPRIYLASAETLLDLVQEIPDQADRVLLIGHNPGLEMLALELTEGNPNAYRGEIEVKYPTASLAVIELDVEHWRDAVMGRGRIALFMRPRELDHELGPDEF